MIFILIKNDETKGFSNLINVSCITLKCNIVLKYVSVLNSKIPLLFGVQLLTLHYKGVTKKARMKIAIVRLATGKIICTVYTTSWN